MGLSPSKLLRLAKNPQRPQGWAKIKGKGLAGAVNLEWDGKTHMLFARAIAEKDNRLLLRPPSRALLRPCG
jgi:hypothetical protein